MIPSVLRGCAALLLLSLLPSTRATVPLNAVLVRAPGEQSPYLLGAWQAGRWRPGDAALARELGAGRYVRHTLGGPERRVEAAAPASLGAPCEDTLFAGLRPATAARSFEVYTSAATPSRPVTVLPLTNSVYRSVVREYLVRRGVRAPDVRLTALLRADLDGDGTQEVIVEASSFRERDGAFPPPTGQPGDYSVLLLRHVSGGRAVTTVLGAYVAPPTPWTAESTSPMPLASVYRLAGLVDVNGDGRLELLTYGAYYEGDAFAAQEWTPAGGPKVRLETGCGA